MTQQNKVSIVTLLLILLFGIMLMSSCGGRNGFKEEGVYTKGEVIKVKAGRRGKTSIHFTYTVNNRSYKGSTSYNQMGSATLKSKLLGSKKWVPVIYLNSDPSKSKTVITVYDFSKLGLTQPDSLKWIEDYR
jgi:hypothetical protein